MSLEERLLEVVELRLTGLNEQELKERLPHMRLMRYDEHAAVEKIAKVYAGGITDPEQIAPLTGFSSTLIEKYLLGYRSQSLASADQAELSRAEDIKTIRTELLSGEYNPGVIAEKVQRSAQGVMLLIYKNEIETAAFQQGFTDLIRKSSVEGQTIWKIMKKTGLSESTIKKYAHKQNIKLSRSRPLGHEPEPEMLRESPQLPEEKKTEIIETSDSLTADEKILETIRTGTTEGEEREKYLWKEIGCKLLDSAVARVYPPPVVRDVQESLVGKIKQELVRGDSNEDILKLSWQLGLPYDLIYKYVHHESARLREEDSFPKEMRRARKSGPRKFNEVQLRTALAEGENSLEKLCAAAGGVSSYTLMKKCKEYNLTLPDNLIPYPTRPEIDDLIPLGLMLEEMGKRVKLSRQRVWQYIWDSGQESVYKAAREKIKSQVRAAAQDILENQLATLENRVAFLQVLNARRLELARGMGWPQEKAMQYLISKKDNTNYPNYHFEDLVVLFTRYAEAEKGEPKSFEELGEGLPWTAPTTRKILRAFGLESLKWNCESIVSRISPAEKAAMERAYSGKLSAADVGYFLDLPHYVVSQTWAKKGKRGHHRVKSYQSRGGITNHLASQIYEARDIAPESSGGFTDSEIAELLDTFQEAVEYALAHRTEISAELIAELQVLYPDETIEQPYREGQTHARFEKANSKQLSYKKRDAKQRNAAQQKLGWEKKAELVRQALAAGEKSRKTLCEIVGGVSSRALWLICNKYNIPLSDDLLPYCTKPEIDELVPLGLARREMAERSGASSRMVQMYLHYSGQHEQWKAARERAGIKFRAKAKAGLEKLLSTPELAARPALLSVLTSRIAKEGTWAEQKAWQFLSMVRTRYKFEDLTNLFQRYAEAEQKGEKRSLEELGQGLPYHDHGIVGYIFKTVGLKALRPHGKMISSEQRAAVERITQMDSNLSERDLEYFLGIPYYVINYWSKRGKRENEQRSKPFADFGSHGKVAYHLASQIYEAKDARNSLFDGFTEQEIAELCSTNVQIVNYALRRRQEIGDKLMDELQQLFPEQTIIQPYLRTKKSKVIPERREILRQTILVGAKQNLFGLLLDHFGEYVANKALKARIEAEPQNLTATLSITLRTLEQRLNPDYRIERGIDGEGYRLRKSTFV